MLSGQLMGRAELTSVTERHFRILGNVLQPDAHSVEQRKSVVGKIAL